MTLQLKVDSKEVTEALDELTAKDTKGALQKAVKKAGNFLAGKARAEAPPHPRKLKRSVRARNAKRDKPGAVVSGRHRLSPIVQGGTKDRFTKSGAFRGRITANPFIARTADRYDDEALRIAEDELERQLEL
jgi:hypothetical protein